MRQTLNRPSASPGRVFPQVEHFLSAGTPSGGAATPSADAAVAGGLLALGRAGDGLVGRAMPWAAGAKARVGAILVAHRRGLGAEAAGRWRRADFFWQRTRDAVRRVAGNRAAWAAVAKAVGAPGAKVLDDADRLRQRVVDEVLIDTHLALYNGYRTAADGKGGKGAAGLGGRAGLDRALAHVRYAAALVPYSSWPAAEAAAVLGMPLLESAESHEQAGRWAEAEAAAEEALALHPSNVAAQDRVVRIRFRAALAGLGNSTAEHVNRAEAVALGSHLDKLDRFRRRFPDNRDVYDALANCTGSGDHPGERRGTVRRTGQCRNRAGRPAVVGRGPKGPGPGRGADREATGERRGDGGATPAAAERHPHPRGAAAPAGGPAWDRTGGAVPVLDGGGGVDAGGGIGAEQGHLAGRRPAGPGRPLGRAGGRARGRPGGRLHPPARLRRQHPPGAGRGRRRPPGPANPRRGGPVPPVPPPAAVRQAGGSDDGRRARRRHRSGAAAVGGPPQVWTAFAPRRRGDHVPFTYWALSRRNPWLKLQMAAAVGMVLWAGVATIHEGAVRRARGEAYAAIVNAAGRGDDAGIRAARDRFVAAKPRAADDREAVVNRLYDLSRSRERAAAYDRLRDAVRRRDDPAALAAAEAFLAAPYFNAATPADPREPGVREAYQAAFARWFVRLDDPAAPTSSPGSRGTTS